MSNTKPQIQEAKRTPSMINAHYPHPCPPAKKNKQPHLGIPFKNYRKLKLKKKSREKPEVKTKHLTYTGTKTRITYDFSSEIT